MFWSLEPALRAFRGDSDGYAGPEQSRGALGSAELRAAERPRRGALSGGFPAERARVRPAARGEGLRSRRTRNFGGGG